MTRVGDSLRYSSTLQLILSSRTPGVLPSASHPSYPYGNPYTTSLAQPFSSSSSTATGSKQSHPLLPSSAFHSASLHSLATTLPVLALSSLFEHTTFASPRERGWGELGLESLLSEVEREEATELGTGVTGAAGGSAEQAEGGDPAQPTGQNAGDFEEEEGIVMVDDD